MWQSDISVNNGWGLDEGIERELSRRNIDYTRAEKGSRIVYSVIGDEEIVTAKVVANIVKKVLLYDYKYSYLTNKLYTDLGIIQDLLLAEMLSFDSKYENNYMDIVLSSQYDYSIDGIFHFKMRDIASNWEYMRDMYDSIVAIGEDIGAIASYMHDSALIDGRRLYFAIRDGVGLLIDIGSGELISPLGLFEDASRDWLYTIIGAHARDIYVDSSAMFLVDTDRLKEVMRVTTV